MKLPALFIRRPVLALVVNLVIIIAGLQAIRPLHYNLPATATPQLLADLAAAVAKQDVLIRRMEADHRNLEQVFLELTGKELRS